MSSLADLCSGLHAIVRPMPRWKFTQAENGRIANGVYFVFEVGEQGHDGERIVRIGSHTGEGNLQARLREHATANKDRSIFRKNLGRAILAQRSDPLLAQWEIDLTSRVQRLTSGRRWIKLASEAWNPRSATISRPI